MNEPDVIVGLVVTPEKLSADTDLYIHGTVRNTGSVELNTQLYLSRFLVNDQAYAAWQLIIGNGIGDPREFALPPNERVEFERILPAFSLLPEPGRYKLVLEVLGVRSPAVTVERLL